MRLPESVVLGGSWASVALVQGTLVALAGWLAWLAARRGGPALRAAILLAALVGMLLAPAFASVAPVWLSLPEWACPTDVEPSAEATDVVVISSPSSTSDPALLAVFVAQPPTKDLSAAEGAAKQADEAPQPVKAEAVVLNVVASSEETLPLTRPSPPPRPSWSVPGLLAALWLFGAAVCLIRALVRLALLYRCAWQARAIRTRTWTECVESLARRHGVPRVALRESWEIASPLTLGLFRPVILLPRGRRSWSAEQRALILGHELAHIRRRDYLVGLVAELVVCLCWFHPLVRWLAGRLRLEQEFAADAWVASAAADPTDYVRCLARLALELERGHGLLAPAFWRRRPEILRRIDMLRRNPQGLSTRLGKRAGWTVAALAAAACLVAGGVGRLHSAGEGQKATEAAPPDRGQANTDRQGDPLPSGALARLGTNRLRHGSDITFVAFGPGGKTLLTAGRDNTVRLWDLSTGKEIRRFAQPKPAPAKPRGEGAKGQADQAEVEAVIQLMGGGGNQGSNLHIAVTADGKTLAIGRGNVIQFYDVQTGEALRQIEAKANGIAGLLFSPDGRTLAGRGGNGTLFVWATESGKELHQIKPPPRPQRDGIVLILGGGDAEAPGMAFSPDGKTLAASATDYKGENATRSVKFWDLTTGKETRRINAPDTVGSIALAPRGEVVAYSVGNLVHLCEVKTGKELRQLKTLDGRIAALAFTPDGKTLAIRGRNQRVGLWDTETGKERHRLSEAQPRQQGGGLVFFTEGISATPTRPVALSSDGKRVVAAAGNTVRLWETATGQEVPLSEGHWKAPSTILLTQEGKTVVSWGADRVVRRWEAGTGKLLGTFPAPAGTTRAALSTDGRTVALANTDNTIRLHDATTGKELHRLKAHANGTAALAFTSDGKVLASRGSADERIRIYDVAAGRELRQIALRPRREATEGTVFIFGGGGASASGPGLAFSPDGKLLAAPGPDGRNSVKTLVLVDVAAGKELRKIELPQPITSLTFSPDGRTLATENADRTITLWEAASGKKQTQLGKPAAEQPQAGGGRMAVEFIVDGMGGGSSEPAGPVGLAFSPDGRALAARGNDQSVHVWDVAAGKEIGQLKGHNGRIQTVSFGPDGKTLVSGATDTTILLWDATAPLKDLAKTPTVELPSTELKTLWGDLAGEDAAKAYRGIQKLSSAPRETVPFLSERLKPAERIDPKKIDGWIGELESVKYPVRQAAATNLLKSGDQAVPALQKVLASSPSLETRKRVEELVEKLTGGTLTTEQLRYVRAVEVLERIGTPEARQVLRTLAQGATGALPTREAGAALQRLAGAPVSHP